MKCTDRFANNYYLCTNQSNKVMVQAIYYPYGGILSQSTNQGVQKYKYNGKEFDTMHGLNMYDYGARQQDPAVGMFTSMDPLCEKYYNISPYVYCAGNPIRYVDPDGQEPTPAEAAAMALHVYGDKDAQKANLGAWQVSKRDFGVSLNTSNGLKSAVYEKIVDGKVAEYAYVTCGTETLKDWEQNAAQVNGLSTEYNESANNAKIISDKVGSNVELTYVGHSQGGGEAALNSLVTSNADVKGRGAITFNAAGISAATKLANGGMETLLKSTSKIDAYVMMTCPLNNIQNYPVNPLPYVDGNIHVIVPKSWDAVLNGHSMLNMYNSIK